MCKMKKDAGVRSFYFAIRGLTYVIRSELNARIHLVVAVLVIIMGILFRISRPEWLVIVLCISTVFVAETFNTAVERLIDLVSPQISVKAGTIKDMAAGAVLLAIIASVVAGAVIFIPYIVHFFNRL